MREVDEGGKYNRDELKDKLPSERGGRRKYEGRR